MVSTTRSASRPLLGGVQARHRVLLALLGILIAVALAAPTASAGAATGTQNGVAAINVEIAPAVEGQGPVSPAVVGVPGPVFDDGAVVSLVTPRATGAADDVGLSGRGLAPAPGTRVRPAGIPDEWRVVPTRSAGGTRYYDPTNPGNSVRVMQGSPNSPFPNSQGPYVRWQRNGQALDVNGNPLPSANVPEAHIPLSDFRFLPGIFG